MSAATETLARLHQAAVSCHAAGEAVRAADMFRGILALDPAHGPALNSLCGNLVREGRREDALALITGALRQGAGQAMLHRIRADLLRQLLRYDEAVEEADRAVAADPGDHQSLMFRSTVHYDRLALAAAGADAAQGGRGGAGLRGGASPARRARPATWPIPRGLGRIRLERAHPHGPAADPAEIPAAPASGAGAASRWGRAR